MQKKMKRTRTEPNPSNEDSFPSLHCARDTVTLLQRETPEFIPRNVATQLAGFERQSINNYFYVRSKADK